MSQPCGLKVFNTFSSSNIFHQLRTLHGKDDHNRSVLVTFNGCFKFSITLFMLSVNSFLNAPRVKLCVFFSNSHTPASSSKLDDESKITSGYIPFYTPPYVVPFILTRRSHAREESHVAIHVVSSLKIRFKCLNWNRCATHNQCDMNQIKTFKLEWVLTCSTDATIFDKTYDNKYWNLIQIQIFLCMISCA